MLATFDAMSIAARMNESEAEARNMKEHEFTLVLVDEPSEEVADRMYGAFNDATISTIAGVPQIHFHRQSGSLEEAIRSAIGDVRSVGYDVALVEIEPNAVAQPA